MSILSYCLANIPKSYDTTYPISTLTNGERGTIRVRICQKKTRVNTIYIDSFSADLGSIIRIIIFNAKAYHSQIFSIGKEMYVLGTLEFQCDRLTNQQIPTLINPRVVTEINAITMQFKTRSIKPHELREKITLQSLLESGIPDVYATHMHTIFNPSKHFFDEYYANNGFPPVYKKTLKFVEIFNYIKRLRNKKINFRAKFSCNGSIDDFLHNLPFRLTNAQMQTIGKIQQDLSGKEACRRIVMGDVGCGKTMVILASAMIAYPQKSILMAPTTILAKQLYEEAKKYLPSYINIKCVISTSKKESKNPLDGDFIIGTQAILYRDGDFSDFALVMTDEQHRFGTSVRAKLEQMMEKKIDNEKTKPHNIQFSATPIPRTMAMLKNNVISFSFIKELPFKKDIDTNIISKKDFSHLIEHIRSEIARGNQIAIIYPKIESNDEYVQHTESNDIKKRNQIPYMSLKDAQDYWVKNFTNVFSTHGKDKEKEEILEQFANTGSSILLATTMIEVGISLPKLSIIVVVGAERLGLASLHQLRGRVSRNGLKGYCYLYTHNTSNERLNRFAKTLSGFDIAEIDLEYRNSGDLLDGVLQSGEHFCYFNFLDDGDLLQEVNDILNTSKIS